MRQHLILFFFSGFFLLQNGCGSDDEGAITGFETTYDSGNEGVGVVNVNINLGKKVTTTTSITFQVAGSALLDGDYSVTTNVILSTSSLVTNVAAGQSTGTLKFTIKDDEHVEPIPESIYFYISNISDESITNLSNYIYEYEVEDNDSAPTDGLQADLSWDLGDGVSIDDDDFDLYLVNNAELTGEEITSYDSVTEISSVSPKGFETYTLPEDLPDGEYFVMIRFNKGTTDAVVRLGISQGTEFTPVVGLISKDYVERNFFYGPITKTGDEFSRRATNSKQKANGMPPGKFIFQKD